VFDVMAMRGLLDRMLERGRQRSVGGTFAGIGKPAPEGLDSAHPYLLGIPQPVIVHLLEDRALELGAEVRRGCAVAGFEQDEAGVTVELAGGEQLRSRYLVGCDGARRTVRKRLGVGFPDEPSRNDTLMGEMEVGVPPDAIAGVGQLSRRWWLRPVGEGASSVVVPAAGVSDGAQPPTLDEFKHQLRALAGTDFGAGPDLLGRRLRDIDVPQGRLYGLLDRGRGLLVDRTERLTVGGWSDRIDHLADPTAGLEVPAVLLRPDGYVAWIGDDQADPDDHLSRWFGAPAHAV
jgi:hypothetical protein